MPALSNSVSRGFQRQGCGERIDRGFLSRTAVNQSRDRCGSHTTGVLTSTLRELDEHTGNPDHRSAENT
jgi:hypothetical protein